MLFASDEITRLHLGNPQFALRQTLVGSQQEIREKEQLAEQLKRLIGYVEPRRASQLPAVPLDPAYFPDLADLTARVLRRRAHATGALRVLEFVGVETIAARGPSWTEAFPDSDPFDAKLASDVARFLARACNLSPELVTQFDAAIGQGGSGGSDGPPAEKAPVRVENARPEPVPMFPDQRQEGEGHGTTPAPE